MTSSDARGQDYLPLTLTAVTPEAALQPNAPVHITLAIENTSGRTLKFPLQEKDVNGKPLPYPAGLTIRLVDREGRVLTENDESRDEWWSWYLTWPQVMLARKASKDRITMKPGQRIERTVNLEEILGGLDALNGKLPAGTYTVQFALRGLKSNELTIDVGDTRTRLRRTDRRKKP